MQVYGGQEFLHFVHLSTVVALERLSGTFQITNKCLTNEWMCYIGVYSLNFPTCALCEEDSEFQARTQTPARSGAIELSLPCSPVLHSHPLVQAPKKGEQRETQKRREPKKGTRYI